jgi:hypothetical protein
MLQTPPPYYFSSNSSYYCNTSGPVTTSPTNELFAFWTDIRQLRTASGSRPSGNWQSIGVPTACTPQYYDTKYRWCTPDTRIAAPTSSTAV